MKRCIFASVFVLCIILSFAWPQGIRKAVWAGKFYEGQAKALSAQIDHFLQSAEGNLSPSGSILALIVPHAGYIYSGKVAAQAYSLVRRQDYTAVVIIGPSHHYGFEGCSIYPKGGYETPLGVVEVDSSLAAELSKASGFSYIPEAHQNEHSVEVQVPFIQKVLPEAKIVPIVMGFPQKKTISSLAEALHKVLSGQKVLVIGSTDMSHFLPKAKANKQDAKTIDLIRIFKIDTLIRKLERRENILCGGGPVASLLLYAKKSDSARIEVLSYADSSDAGGPESQVVGYMSAAVSASAQVHSFSLTAEEKSQLIQLARSAIRMFVAGEKIPNDHPQSPALLEKKGAFVTLKKHGRLRGCIGFIQPLFPLYETVIQAAVYAAAKDVRFQPVKASELEDLEIEISVLSPMEKIRNPNLVKVGQHGLFVSKGGEQGFLLPQVPVENGWTRTAFLEQACMKAGLLPDAWKHGADIYVFTAIVFR